MTERTRASWLVYALGALCAGAIVAAVLLVGPASGSQASVTRTATVARGVVQSTVSGSGTLQPATKVGVDFATSGTLTGLFVSVGDHVTSGQLLAEIDPSSAESSLRSAEMSLTTEEAAYQAALEGLTPVEVRENEITAAQSHASVASVEQSLRQARQTAKSDAAASAATVAQDEVSLKAAEQSVALEATSEQDAVNQAISQRGVEEKALAEARSQLEEAKSKLEEAKSALAGEKGKSPSSASGISAAESKVSSAESKVTSAEATIKSDEAKVAQDSYSITTAQNSQAAAALKGQQSIDSARNAVTNAKQSLAATKLKDQQSIEQAQTSLTSARQSLQATLASNEAKAAPPTRSTVVSAENSVESARLTVETARRTLSETKLYAPTAGVVASIKDSVGEAVTGTGGSSGETSSASTGSTTSASSSHGDSGASGTGASTSGSTGTSGSAAGGDTHAGGTSSGAAGGSTGATGSATESAGGGSGGATGTTGSATGGASTGATGSGSSGSGSAGAIGSGTTGAASGATYSGGASYHDIAATSGGAGTSSSGAGASSSAASTGSESTSTSSSSFIELVDLHGYQLVVPLSESEISNVHVGQIATVTVEALEGRKFAAHVVSLPVLSTSSSGVVSYDVTFQLDQAEPGLKPGMSATAEVVVKQAEGVNVPTSAISADTVTVIHNGKQERKRVVTGLAGNSSTIILSGLNAGEEIALPVASTSSSTSSLSSRLGSRLGGGGLGGGLGGAGGGLGGAGGGGAAFFRGGG
jgi:multidrug efflux pump subunit AcrA (membrane-fusion protein)